MIASDTNMGKNGRGFLAHAAIIKTDKNGVRSLICFQCNRLESKRRDIDMLPFIPRWTKKINNATGIVTTLRRWRKRVNDFIYVNIRGGQPTGNINKHRDQHRG